MAVSSLCAFLSILQEAVPGLRIVVAGRVPLSVDGFPTNPRELGDFDDDAARAFLERRGVRSPELIRTIIKRIGKCPLSLLLAATVVQQARQSGEAEDLKLTGTRGARLSQGQIQGYLYRRILNHIQDDEVRRLAYPGLVLRRVTPGIIYNVLAKPCGVPVGRSAAGRYCSTAWRPRPRSCNARKARWCIGVTYAGSCSRCSWTAPKAGRPIEIEDAAA